jgi:hypothetical protein
VFAPTSIKTALACVSRSHNITHQKEQGLFVGAVKISVTVYVIALITGINHTEKIGRKVEISIPETLGDMGSLCPAL